MRSRFCKMCEGWHTFDDWPAECIPQSDDKRSPLGVPYIRSDGMDPVRNHADGRMYDSRSGFEKAVKAAGCEILGNDKPDIKRDFKPSVTGHDVKQAIEQIKGRP